MQNPKKIKFQKLIGKMIRNDNVELIPKNSGVGYYWKINIIHYINILRRSILSQYMKNKMVLDKIHSNE